MRVVEEADGKGFTAFLFHSSTANDHCCSLFSLAIAIEKERRVPCKVTCKILCSTTVEERHSIINRTGVRPSSKNTKGIVISQVMTIVESHNRT